MGAAASAVLVVSRGRLPFGGGSGRRLFAGRLGFAAGGGAGRSASALGQPDLALGGCFGRWNGERGGGKHGRGQALAQTLGEAGGWVGHGR
jgi:hypothetical protein